MNESTRPRTVVAVVARRTRLLEPVRRLADDHDLRAGRREPRIGDTQQREQIELLDPPEQAAGDHGPARHRGRDLARGQARTLVAGSQNHRPAFAPARLERGGIVVGDRSDQIGAP